MIINTKRKGDTIIETSGWVVVVGGGGGWVATNFNVSSRQGLKGLLGH